MFRFLRLLIIIICLGVVSGALEPTDAEASEELRFLHHDHLGSVVAVSGDKGEKVWEERYLPFGSNVSNSVTSVNQINTVTRQYTGQESDYETNLYNYNARLYNPRLGQFVAADRGGQGGNGYAYVRNNPLRFTDPSGNAFEHGDGGGGGGKSGLELQISGGSALEQQPEIAATQPTASSQTRYQPPPVEWREAEFVWLMTNLTFTAYTFPPGVKWLQALYWGYQLDKLARSQSVQTVGVGRIQFTPTAQSGSLAEIEEFEGWVIEQARKGNYEVILREGEKLAERHGVKIFEYPALIEDLGTEGVGQYGGLYSRVPGKPGSIGLVGDQPVNLKAASLLHELLAHYMPDLERNFTRTPTVLELYEEEIVGYGFYSRNWRVFSLNPFQVQERFQYYQTLRNDLLRGH